MLEPDVIDRVLAEAKRNGAPFAEIYVEDRRSTSVSFDDGRVDQVSNGRDRGAGIRVVRGETTGYAHTADLSEQGLIAAARAAADAAGRGDGGSRVVGLAGRAPERGERREVVTSPTEVSKSTRVEILEAADEAARSV